MGGEARWNDFRSAERTEGISLYSMDGGKRQVDGRPEAWRWICMLNNGGGWRSVRDRVRVADDLKGSLEILIQGVASQ